MLQETSLVVGFEVSTRLLRVDLLPLGGLLRVDSQRGVGLVSPRAM